MKKALFMPFLTMQTGHHQVSDALMEMITRHFGHVEVKKVDLLHYANPVAEKMISSVYLSWVKHAPRMFERFYQRVYDQPQQAPQNYKVYELLLKYLRQLLATEQPDIIFCTHSAPSYLLSVLKQRGQCDIPVVNVYTDYFMSHLWGYHGIEYHFIPMEEMARDIGSGQVIVTGIPIQEDMQKSRALHNYQKNVLITGGNCGLMSASYLYKQLKQDDSFHYYILCGNNKKLYKQLRQWNLGHVTPLPYISSRAEMNALYDQMDAIVTKPGGVTISEAIHKGIPIFVHAVLPGQERHNLKFLLKQQLGFELDTSDSFPRQLQTILYDEHQMQCFEEAVIRYKKQLDIQQTEQWIVLLEQLMSPCIAQQQQVM